MPPTPDEHQCHQDEQAVLGHRANVHRAEPGCSADGLEERIQHADARIHVAKAAGIRPLGEQECERAEPGQAGGRHQDELRVQRQGDEATVPDDILHDRVREATDEEQRGDRQEHRRLVAVAGQASILPDEIEARVVESRHGVEHAPPDGAERVHLAEEAEGEHDRSDAFDDECKDDHVARQRQDRSELPGAERFAQQQSLAQRRATPAQQAGAPSSRS